MVGGRGEEVRGLGDFQDVISIELDLSHIQGGASHGHAETPALLPSL